MPTIAFYGLGMMGSQMASRLRTANHSMRVWNRTRSKTDEWTKGSGGVACATPEEAARGADEIHLMLANDEAVEAVLFGSDGALKSLSPGSLVVDHSTVSVMLTETRAKRVKEGGWRYLHAPVLAGPAGVAKGEGLMMVGGTKKVFDSAAPVLRQIIDKLWHLGESERDAAAFKLMANSMLFSITEALAEFFSLGRACAIKPDRALQLFENFDPSRTFFIRGPRMARGDYAPAFTASMAAKDADLMLHAARQGGASMPIIELVLEKLLRLMKSGHGDLDLGALGHDSVRSSDDAHHAKGDLTKVGGDG